jgi:hypothetical protein
MSRWLVGRLEESRHQELKGYECPSSYALGGLFAMSCRKWLIRYYARAEKVRAEKVVSKGEIVHRK